MLDQSSHRLQVFM